MSVPFLNLKVLRSNQQRSLCEYESDLRINEHYYSSSENMAWKKNKAYTGFKPMTIVIPVQCSTNWAKKPTESWLLLVPNKPVKPSALQSPKINHLILENLKGSYIGILFEQKLFNSLRVTIGGSLN